MRGFLAAILFIALFAAGCTEKNYYPTALSYKEQVLGHIESPATGVTVETLYHWTDEHGSSSNYCPWGYYADTAHNARVSMHIGGGALIAQVYYRQEGYNEYSPSSSVYYPFAEEFTIPFINRSRDYRSSISPDTFSGSFYVKGLTFDSTVWVTQAISYRHIIRVAEITTAPPPPTIYSFTVDRNYRGLSLYWCNTSPGVDTSYVYTLRQGSSIIDIDTVRTDYRSWSSYAVEPNSTYLAWVRVGNEYGLSMNSDTALVITDEPSPPYHLYGIAHGSQYVSVTWRNREQWCDSLVVAHRDPQSEWAEISSWPVIGSYYLPDNYADSTAFGHGLNYYRVGYRYLSGTWWSTDSTGVWMP